MCHLSKKDQYVCQINQGIAEAVTGVLGGAQFPSCPFYHPRSSRCRLGHTREAAVCAGNFPDSNGISDYFKRQKRSHQTEPVPMECEFFKNNEPGSSTSNRGRAPLRSKRGSQHTPVHPFHSQNQEDCRGSYNRILPQSRLSCQRPYRPGEHRHPCTEGPALSLHRMP